MTKHATSVATTAWAVAWFFLAAANASTVIPPTFEKMTDRADLVFVGKVAGSRAELRSVGTNRVFFTLVDFETNQLLKWNAESAAFRQQLSETESALSNLFCIPPDPAPGVIILTKDCFGCEGPVRVLIYSNKPFA